MNVRGVYFVSLNFRLCKLTLGCSQDSLILISRPSAAIVFTAHAPVAVFILLKFLVFYRRGSIMFPVNAIFVGSCFNLFDSMLVVPRRILVVDFILMH